MRLFSILDFFSHDRKYLVPFNLDLFNLERKQNNKYQIIAKIDVQTSHASILPHGCLELSILHL